MLLLKDSSNLKGMRIPAELGTGLSLNSTPRLASHRQFPPEEVVGFPSFLFWALDATCTWVLVRSSAFNLMHGMRASGVVRPTQLSNPYIGCKSCKGPGKLSGDNWENMYDT